MLRTSVVVLCVVAMMGGMASANNIAGLDLGLLYGFGMFSSFDADGGPDGSGIQTIDTNNGAYIFYEDMTSVYFDKTEIGMTGIIVTDQSSGGEAQARFADGEWHARLYDPCDHFSIVFEIGGDIVWYKEVETDDNAVDGEGIVTLDNGITYVDPVFFGGAVWDSTDGKSGIETFISNILPVPFEDYSADWSSTNVTAILWADSSMIPEPITMVLLGVGALGLLRRRR